MKEAIYKSGYYVFRAFALSMPSVGGLEDSMNTMRIEVEEQCQRYLRVAEWSVSTRGQDICSAYSWARGNLYGMKDAFYIIGRYDLCRLIHYYYEVADNKITRTFLH